LLLPLVTANELVTMCIVHSANHYANRNHTSIAICASKQSNKQMVKCIMSQNRCHFRTAA